MTQVTTMVWCVTELAPVSTSAAVLHFHDRFQAVEKKRTGSRSVCPDPLGSRHTPAEGPPGLPEDRNAGPNQPPVLLGKVSRVDALVGHHVVDQQLPDFGLLV